MLMVSRQSVGQQRRQNGRPAGAIESASRFYGTNEITATAIVSVDVTALTCQTISSDHILTYPNPGGAIAVIHGDRGGHCRRRLRRHATAYV